jgi:hypothetical protein
MDPVVIAVVAIVIIALAIGAWFYLRSQRTKQLRSKFGPEYSRAVRSEGSESAAEKALHARQQRVERLKISPLNDQQRARFVQQWEKEQARFVDEPRAAIESADRLVAEVMKVRGYPVTDFEQRVEDVSVDHPVVVENYRIAHDIALRDQREPVDTEELRQAMIHYRALFADLLHDGGMQPVRDVSTDARRLAREAGR